MATITFQSSGISPRDLPAAVRQHAEAIITAGMRGTATGMVLEMRQNIRGTLRGNRAPTLITGKGYPDRPGQTSLAAAAVARARGYNAADIIKGQEEGGTIVPKARKYLVIPTGAAGTYGGKRLTLRDAEARFGKRALAFIPNKTGGGVVVLRADAARPGTARGAKTIRNRGLPRGDAGRKADVVLFILKPAVTLIKKLNLTGIAEKWSRQAGQVVQAAAAAVTDGR